MMKLITGMPGNGKTLRAIYHLVEAKKENDKLVAAGKAQPRNFYSNIDGVKLDFVKHAEKDWRQYPDGSYIVYDEAHQLFPATGRPGRADDPIINQMDEHRHRGFDIVFVTQWPSKIHHECRQLIGHHEHLHRSMGLELAGLLTWDRVQLDPYDKAAKGTANDETWHFPKELYQHYASSTLHTTSHKFKMPAKMKNFLLSIPFVLLIIWGLFWAFTNFLMPKDANAAEPGTEQSAVDSMLASAGVGKGASPAASTDTPQNLLPPTGEYTWQNAQLVKPIAGCVSSDRNCRCFDSEGNVMDLRMAACRNVLKKPMPFNIFHEFKEPQRQYDRGAGVPPAVEPLTSNYNMNSGGVGPSGSRAEPSSVGPPADKVKGWIRSY